VIFGSSRRKGNLQADALGGYYSRNDHQEEVDEKKGTHGDEDGVTRSVVIATISNCVVLLLSGKE
jgi:hypothetical protein